MNIQVIRKSTQGKDEVEIVYSTQKARQSMSIDYKTFLGALTEDESSSTPQKIVEPLLNVSEGNFIAQTEAPVNDADLSQLNKFNDFLLENLGNDIKTLHEAEPDLIFTIESSEHYILSLPWELLFEDKMDSFRMTRRVSGGLQPQEATRHNYLVLLSHSFFDGLKELPNLASDFYSELQPILESLLENNRKGENKPQLFSVVKYVSPEVISKLDIDECDNLHLIMHGRENGALGFEDPSDYSRIAWLDPQEFIDKFKSSKPFNFIFLSCCYSGYGDMRNASLAYKLVQAGVCNYVVAFNGSVGSEKTLPMFAKEFYKQYMVNGSVQESFHRAFKLLAELQKPYWYRPVLYARGSYE